MDFSVITPQLLVGTQPQSADYTWLHAANVRLVINMRFASPPEPDPAALPVESLWLRTVDSPFIPAPLKALRRGVLAALPVLADGNAVYTHCAHGRHRGPAMAACILVAQGYSAEDALDLIKRQRPHADPHIWYIRSWVRRFARTWR